MAEFLPWLASLTGKLSQSEVQIQMDLAIQRNADSPRKCAGNSNSQQKSRDSHRNISLGGAIS
jgi:hypothetical protein